MTGRLGDLALHAAAATLLLVVGVTLLVDDDELSRLYRPLEQVPQGPRILGAVYVLVALAQAFVALRRHRA